MGKYRVQDIRNVAFCGHGGSGKTTLVDTLLGLTGTVKRPASVDEGTSICDFDEEEKAHKYSIETSVVHFEHGGKWFHVIDTPGYPDFINQTISALRGVDMAAVVINAQAGIEVNTRRVFAEAEKAGVGRMIVISKMDLDNIDFPGLLENIQEVFGSRCVPMNVPLGHGAGFRGVAGTLRLPEDLSGTLVDAEAIHESLIESIVMGDEEVMERYLEGSAPSDEELARLLKLAVADGSLIPMVCLSTKKGIGLNELLEALVLCGLSPDQVKRTATGPGDEPVEVQADPAGPLVAQVFKTRIDPFVQKLSFIRVYSGTLTTGSTVPVVGQRKGVKLGQLLRVQASETEPIESAGPGDIVAVAKMEEFRTGTTLGQVTMPPLPFPTPMVGLAASPKSRGDEAKLSGAVAKVSQEDPTFVVERDAQTKEMVITGMSELHLQIIQERLKRRDKVEMITKEPKIPYRETIQATAEGSYRHKKQTGGRGQFGEVHIRMFPLPAEVDPEQYATKERFPSMKEYHYHPDCNFLWIDSIVGGTIPSNFMPAVEKGFLDRIDRGVIAGYRVQNVCVEVYFGKHHPVDSSEQSFRTAASMVFRNVFMEARPALLEPIVKMAVTVPADAVGDINSDLSGRRGRVLGMDSAGGGMQTITAEVPLAEVTTYARSLSSITGGQGSYTLEFTRYDVVPGNIQQEIIRAAKLEEEEE
ncbi:MAG TPA: elongation factor G [Planctomycetaceae bacterium]|nr:elongation factor G [Planctomycetaceae bacterium]HIQ20696.1 elongation factor G [Planctomycetota bacterium]